MPETALRPEYAESDRPRRLRAAIGAARVASWCSRTLMRRGGGVIGGRVLVRIEPNAPDLLAAGREISLVSGTNGKSTVTAMLAAAVGSQGPVASNTDGANTIAGLVGALSKSTARRAVLETDEGWLPWAIRRLRPHTVVLLNLSRDQLHRHPEVRLLAESWRESLAEVPTVVANCDDPAVTWAASACPNPVWVAGGGAWREDSLVCPKCGRLLSWVDEHWSCSCGLARPEPTATASSRSAVTVALPGDINQVNARFVLAATDGLGVPPEQAAAAVGTVQQVSGRYAEVDCAGRRVRLLLAKNPASWQQTLKLVSAEARPTVLVFNAEGVDGRDPSWLYDVDFTALRGTPVAVSGRRGSDLSVRLRIDEVESVGQFADVVAAIEQLPVGPVNLIANYTAFQETRRRLA